jgi:acetyl esterase/lipase
VQLQEPSTNADAYIEDQVSGSSLFEPWFPKWLLELAVAKKAIMVSSNYRLLPESSGLDIMEELDDLWNWMNSGLKGTLSSFCSLLSVDLDRIMTEGDSAGTPETAVLHH